MRARFFLPLLALLLLLPLTALAADGDVAVASVDATSWIKGKDPDAYAPHRMIDEDETTAFQFSTKVTPLGQEYITFSLGYPSSVSTLQIKNGFWRITNGNDQYVRNSRVKTMRVDFEYNYAGAFSDAITVTLPDDKTRSTWTSVSLGNHEQVTAVRFLIQEIYTGSKYKTDVCISEVRFSSEASHSASDLYGLATQKLATRSGPGTQYTEQGTYNVAGQYIKILSRAWDDRNSIWWVKCEIPYKEETRVLWTGYKRFDSSTIPLDTIPVENGSGNSIQQAAQSTATPSSSTWQEAYYRLISSGE